MKVKWIFSFIIAGFLSLTNVYSMKNTAESTSSWIGAVWSYVNYHIKNKEYGVAETYNYIYYTVKDEPTQLNGKVYYPLIRYVEDDEVGEVLFHIRQEGDAIYRYMSSLKCDTLFYDFSLKTDDICKIAGIYDTDRFKIGKISTVQTKTGTIFRVFEILACYGNNEWGPIDEWIEGIGSENGLFYQYDINGSTIGNYGSTLNYYRSGNGEVVYKNPHSFREPGTTDYKWDDRYANEAKPYYSLLVDGTEWILRLENELTKKETYLTQRLDGDSLLNDTLFKKLYSKEYHTNGSQIADTIHLLYQEKNLLLNRNKVIFNFGMHGLPEYLNQQGCIMYAIQTSDTVLIDGVSHRSLSIVKKGENEIFDTWIEGIGSLQYGITQSFPIPSSTIHSELLSCSLNGKYLYNKKGTVSPVDKTHLLVNPDYANNDNTGWSGTTPAFQTYQNAEHYNKKFNTYQDLANMPNGVYAVSVKGFYRAGNKDEAAVAFEKGNNQFAKLYAKSGEDSLNTSLPSIHAGAVETPYGFNSVDEIQAGNKNLYIPNTLKAAATYLQHEAYCTTLFFAVEGGNARIGIAKDTLIWQDWTAWQDWTLAYYGNDEAAYLSWLDFAKSKAPRFDDVVLTVGLLDAYNALLSDNSVPNKIEVLSAIHALEEKAAELKANSEAWMAYDKAVKDLQSILEDPTILEFGNCDVAYYDSKEYYEQTALEIIQSRLLTTEEVIAETQQAETLINMFSYSPSLLRKPPVNKSYIQIEALDRPVARLVVDLTVPFGYTQQIDSIVGPRIYVSGTYTWDGGASSAHRIEVLDLGELPEGSYYLQHQIKDLSESREGPETSYFISFSIKSPEAYGKDPLKQEIVNQSYLYPTLKTADDEIILVTDLMVNCSYQQQIDSIVGDQIYLSGSYDLYSVNCQVSPTISQFSLGKYSPGRYTLHHRISVKNGSEVLKETTYTIPFVVRAGSQIEEIDSDHLLVVDGKEWNSEVVAPLPPQYASYRSRQYISGDTIYQGESYKVLYEQRWYIGGKETEEILALIRQVGNKVYSTHPRLYYDFGLFQGDFVEDYAWGTSETRGGWLIKEVSDTILTDGISRRCLKVDYVVIPKEGERFIEYSDIWVEGIGSLYHGLVLQSPAVSGWGDYTLESVLSDGKYQYVKEAFGIHLQTQKKNIPIYHSSNGTFRCTSPTATLLEVYTSTGIKVGEAVFQNGEAVVEVGSNVPSLYLYVVTYPDGTRSSGKMMRK